jgi:hypothetical protein
MVPWLPFMFSEPMFAKRFGLLLFALLLIIAGDSYEGSAVAAPVKARTTRRSFDFERPKPGEMLANPAEGDGAPPSLSQFAPSSGDQPENGAATANGPSATSLAAPMTDVNSVSPPTAAEPLAAGAMTPQMHLADRIVRLGIDASLTGLPEGDPALGPEEKRTSTLLQQNLATSLAQWKALFGQSEPVMDESLDVQIMPGQVILRRAPGRLTGADEASQ